MHKLFTGAVLAAAVSFAAVTPAGAHTNLTALDRGESVASADGSHVLVHQDDGNVVLYGGGQAVWDTSTRSDETDTFVLQDDGNLVLYTDDGVPLWHSKTQSSDAFARVQDDGNVVVYGAEGPLWASRTPPKAENTASSYPYGDWDRLAECESGGNWSANTGNGHSGGLQWSSGSWSSFKDGDDPGFAANATRDQEIAAAERYKAYEQRQGRGGYGPWPSCARQLGLPR